MGKGGELTGTGSPARRTARLTRRYPPDAASGRWGCCRLNHFQLKLRPGAVGDPLIGVTVVSPRCHLPAPTLSPTWSVVDGADVQLWGWQNGGESGRTAA